MYQQIIIVGYLGRDPEMRYTPAGQPVTSFPVATNRSYTGADGSQIKETTWFRVTVWGKTGDACNTYLQKGSKVMIQGRLTPDMKTGGPRIYQRSDGTMGTSYELVALVVRFLSDKPTDSINDRETQEVDDILF